MKKGKTSQLTGFKTAKVVYGTVDSVNLKSLYLNIQTWVEPIYESDNWSRTVLNLSRGVKHSVYESLNNKIFDTKFIVDLDLRSSGLNLGKKSFMNLEVNFYVIEENLDFKSKRGIAQGSRQWFACRNCCAKCCAKFAIRNDNDGGPAGGK